MKTLENHTIVYNDECPMCNLYTGAFVKSGMLDKEGRIPYSDYSQNPSIPLNLERAGNEIALINRKDQTVIYGLSSLTTIIGTSFPYFNPLFSTKIFKWVMEPLYFFVSYNRKVIAPATLKGNGCIPSYNVKYRLAYLLFSWFVTSLILNYYASSLAPLVPATTFYREFLLCGGQIFFQGIMISFIRRGAVLAYLGNFMTISLAGAILLLLIKPVLSVFFSLPVLSTSYLFLLVFLVTVFLMLMEHIRRVKLLQLPWYVSAGWVGYRLLVLLIIL